MLLNFRSQITCFSCCSHQCCKPPAMTQHQHRNHLRTILRNNNYIFLFQESSSLRFRSLFRFGVDSSYCIVCADAVWKARDLRGLQFAVTIRNESRSKPESALKGFGLVPLFHLDDFLTSFSSPVFVSVDSCKFFVREKSFLVTTTVLQAAPGLERKLE